MDDLDRNIIRLLQKDARMPFTEMARELDKPDTTVHFRTRRLLENGVVKRLGALVAPESCGYGIAGLLEIEIGGHILPEISQDRTVSFAEELSEREQFLWVSLDREPMRIHALLLGKDEDDLKGKVQSIEKSPDVVNISLTPLASVLKGWEITSCEGRRA
ncbi:AsnC family transcriptional regulator [Candidatus Thorarchaeota archaeon]|nr:MAG: AsnC family transcriptional regulator [Candidatus Thorarchaeota archaeon]